MTGSGFTDLIESGSNKDPDLKPWEKYIGQSQADGKGTMALTYFIAVLQLLEQSYFCHHLVHFALFKN